MSDRETLEADSGVRREVTEFASLMEARLQENDFKGGWEGMDPEWLLKRLIVEAGELAEAVVRGEGIEDECADVANFAMMLADVAGPS